MVKYVKSMSAAARTPSMWLLTPAAEMIFQKAKERIYIMMRDNEIEKYDSSDKL